MVVPEEKLMYECPCDLSLQAVFAAVNLLQSVEPVNYLGAGGNVRLSEFGRIKQFNEFRALYSKSGICGVLNK